MSAVQVLAYAKVNLGLVVKARRPDGFHEIETLFQSVSISDVVRIAKPERPGGLSLDVRGLEIPRGRGNLAWEAASLMMGELGVEGASLSIEKRIPVAAGLGGGSADAAAVLAGIDLLYQLRTPRARLAELALRLGSDVPFMLRGGAAIGRGRGNVLETVEPLSGMWLVLVTPKFGVTAAEAYGMAKIGLTEHSGFTKVKCSALRAANAGALQDALRNDLEAGVVSARPEVAEIKSSLLRSGAMASAMSGSGPTVYGVVESEVEGNSVASRLSGRGWAVHVVEPIDIGHSLEWVDDWR